MTEAFLHYIWNYGLISGPLQTTLNEAVVVINTGTVNTDAGPDVFNCRISIDGTQWAGNAEIHLRSSDWLRHGHGQDSAYDNIVLHIVYEDDFPVYRNNGKSIPTIELKGRFDENLWNRYQKMIGSRAWVACENQLSLVPDIKRAQWLERLMVNRLERRVEHIDRIYQMKNCDWAETFYILLVRNFGFHVNAMPFELLAKSLPWKILARHRNQPLQLDALLYGQAGFLNGLYADAYPRDLQKEYLYLQKKYHLQPIDVHLWKMLRMRPSNFPQIRIAQLAQLVHCVPALLSEILEAEKMDRIFQKLETETASYWLTHYQFDQVSAKRKKNLGPDAIRLILINSVIPFLFLYGKKRDQQGYCDKALRWMQALPPENNVIVRKWAERGWPARDALEGQALLELKEHFCRRLKCLECQIGSALLR